MTDHKQNPAEIYLVPMLGDDGDHIWSEDPAPGEGMREEDATRYVRADLVPESNAILAQRIAELTEKLSHHDYVIAQSENATGILCGNDMPGNLPLVLMARKAIREKAALGAQVEQLDAQVKRFADAYINLQEKMDSEQAQVENILKGDLTPEQYHRLVQSSFAAEVRAQAIEDFYKALMRSPNISVTGKEIIAGIYLCRPKQLHPQVATQDKCLVCGGYHGNNMQCHNLLPMAKAGN